MDYKTARRKALFLLARRHYHSQVLYRKLIEKKCPAKIAEKVIEDCHRMHLFDDVLAIMFELRKGFGPRAIQYKLGLSSDQVQAVISKSLQKEQIEKMLPRLPTREKAYQTLLRKGFDMDLILESLSHFEKC